MSEIARTCSIVGCDKPAGMKVMTWEMRNPVTKATTYGDVLMCEEHGAVHLSWRAVGFHMRMPTEQDASAPE